MSILFGMSYPKLVIFTTPASFIYGLAGAEWSYITQTKPKLLGYQSTGEEHTM
jgi:hypothetical protein